MGHLKRIQNSSNGRVKASLSGAYSRNYHYYDCRNDEKHTEERVTSTEEKAGIINPANLLNNTKDSKVKMGSREEIEKDKTSAPSMVGEPTFFKEVEGGSKIEISSKMPAPGA